MAREDARQQTFYGICGDMLVCTLQTPLLLRRHCCAQGNACPSTQAAL